MTIISALPLLVAIVGAVIYLTVDRPGIKQLALCIFACGLLVTLFALAGQVVRIG